MLTKCHSVPRGYRNETGNPVLHSVPLGAGATSVSLPIVQQVPAAQSPLTTTCLVWLNIGSGD
jgi:hypothetical protein